jgi:signal transduction histidine kinase
MSDDGRSDAELLRDHVRHKNVLSLRLGAWLGGTLVPLFWALDWWALPDRVWITLPLRLTSTAGALLIAAALRVWPEQTRRHAAALAFVYGQSVASVIAMLCWLRGGYESSYFAGLNLVIIGVGYVFSWSTWVAVAFNALLYGFYMAPCALGWLPVRDPSVVLGNQFFLLSTMLIVVAGQRHRQQLETREFLSSIYVQRANSSLEEALNKLKELDRLKSDFFSNITHELRTPLTMILAPLESLLEAEPAPLPPRHREHLNLIWRSAMKLLKLINDLLDLAKIDERYLRLRVEPTDLTALLSEIIEYAEPLAARKEIELWLDVRKSADDIHVDPEKLQQALVNLVSNALKFTDPGGRVVVWLDSSAEEATVGVEDTGIGVPADRIDAIFERFSQADGSVTRRYGGTGIGLALAKEIVNLHGGLITVESTVGRGSSFVVHLRRGSEHLDPRVLDRRRGEGEGGRRRRSDDREPREWTRVLLERKEYRFLNLEEATERRVANRSGSQGKQAKLLVVEDNVEVLRLLNMQLSEDYDVYLASDGKKGLELARRELPDVIITDYMMPEMDGLCMVRELRADQPTAHIPVVMLSAKNQLDDRIDARQAGAEVYLSKPFSPRELRSALGQLFEQRGRQLSYAVHEQVKSLELISAGLAHEIHNPLNYIRNALFVIQEATAGIRAAARDPDQSGALRELVEASDEKVARMHQIAAKGVERIGRIVELVRNYARDGYPHDPTPFALDAAIRDMAPLLAPASGQEVAVSLDLSADGAKVTCVPEEMQRAIGNLWQNAVDAVGPGGHVAIRTRIEGSSVLLDVVDDGPGIPRDKLGRIFVPFYTTKDPGRGLGLGLSIAYQVIHQAGGSLAVESLERRGTTFRVRLPMA